MSIHVNQASLIVLPTQLMLSNALQAAHARDDTNRVLQSPHV